MKIITYIRDKIIVVCGLLIVVLILAGVYWLATQENNTNKLINNGFLDLASWDSSSDGIFNLNGEWEFYWDKLFTYEDLSSDDIQPDLMAEVPRVWNKYQLGGNNLPGFGAATYRLKVKNAQEGQKYAIRMPAISAAYKLYINDEMLAANGEVGLSPEHFKPQYQPTLVQFKPQPESFDIIIQVANFSYARGGLWNPVYLGFAQSIINYDKAIGYKDLFLVGAFLMMALYYLCVFFMRIDGKRSLYFALLCLTAITMTIIYGDYLINRIFSWVDYNFIVAVDYISTSLAPIILVFLIGELFPEHTSRKIRKLLAIYAVIVSLFILLVPIQIYTSLLYFFQALGVAMAVYAVACAARAYAKNKGDSALIMLGALIVTLGGTYDVFYHNNVISSDFGEVSSVGFLIFLFIQAFILARRFSRSFLEAKRLSEKLIKLDKLKDEFLANTTHELRTPLNAMINIADGISRGTEGPVNESQRMALDLISGSGKRLTNLINDILDYSKLRNLNLKLNIQPVNLRRVVGSVINTLERTNKPEGVQLVIDIPDGIPDIKADENRLVQIFYNLLGNALKFTESGYIKVSAVQVEDALEICVKDTGVGIPEEKQKIIFDSFKQLEDSLTRRSGGAGLGLYITKHLVEAHGGEINVKSKVGVGSEFFFTIPVSTGTAIEKPWDFETSEAEMATTQYSGSDINKFPFRYAGEGPHIMLVDDNRANLISLAGILRLKNYTITAITSSEEFFTEFNTSKDVSLVILDVMLPGLSGYEICREIRKKYTVSELPVLMLTARTTTKDIVMGMEAGANDYLAKPFDTDELLARVGTLIQLKISVDKAMASELAFLQAQIKPHFLYNALNTFASISLYDIDKARKLIIEFGNYLRRTFDFKNLSQLAPLKNEIELVKAYLEIEKARFEERIEVTYDLPDNLEIKIPILTLQPIVENAVIHGILPKDEGGRIEITIKEQEEKLVFMVKDNGACMDSAQKSRIFDHDFGSGIGLSNIDYRLKKLYGKGLNIMSNPGSGTEVRWEIPIR